MPAIARTEPLQGTTPIRFELAATERLAREERSPAAAAKSRIEILSLDSGFAAALPVLRRISTTRS